MIPYLNVYDYVKYVRNADVAYVLVPHRGAA